MTQELQIQTARELILSKVRGKTLGDLLLRNAQQSGDAPAYSYKEGTIWRTESWRRLREQVLDVGCGLASLGLVRGDVVAVMAANRPEHLMAVLGAAHAAATPSTLYSTLTAEQIQYVADNCSARVAILENRGYMERWVEILDKLPRLEHVVLMQDAEAFRSVEGVQVHSWQELCERGASSREEHGERWREAKPEDAATIIYTSGTTGPPKGVALTHLNCLWEAEALDRTARLPDGVSNVSYLPLAHIAEQILSIYIPLQKAAHVYYCPVVTEAVEYVKEARPIFFFGVPRVWEKMRAGITTKMAQAPSPLKRKLARAAIDAGLELVRLQQRGEAPLLWLRLRHALLERLVLGKVRAALGLDRCAFAASAAAPLPVDVSEFFAALGLPIVEVYGMTETTGVATCPDPKKIKIGTVGPALPGVELVLAADGEVLVRGPNCTPGYINRPEATAELIDADGWLHTGDIGVQDSEGYIRIVDRKKELIITAGGKNISPANLENALKEHPLVGQALAYGDRKPFVVALIVLDGEVAPGWARERGIAYADLAELAGHPQVQAEVDRAVAAANERVARVEQVKRFSILPAEWTAESEELTPTMKLKRRVIHAKYSDEIEGLYN
jgi:long-subunit acyl-CoA synthetase (AMP-forming)